MSNSKDWHELKTSTSNYHAPDFISARNVPGGVLVYCRDEHAPAMTVTFVPGATAVPTNSEKPDGDHELVPLQSVAPIRSPFWKRDPETGKLESTHKDGE